MSDFDSSYLVRIGIWTNWSRGAVFGATLTLNQANSALLIAFVAFFVAWVGTHCWRIVCLVLHFLYSSQEPRDGLHHQRQVLLRNSANPETGFILSAYIAWAWRNQSNKSFLRLLVVATVALVCAAGFAVASGFSSRISGNMGFNVLLTGTNCAIINNALVGDSELAVFELYRGGWIKNWANYALQCYGPTTSTSRLLECGTFVRQQLNSNILTNASCPFHPRLCKSQDHNLLIDTGYLNSNDDLGINAPPQERFLLRRVVHCAPLVTEGHTSQFNRSAERSYTRFYYGPKQDIDPDPNDFTYEHPNNALSDLFYTHGQGPVPDYSIVPKVVYNMHEESMSYWSHFRPIPELEVENADLAMFFMAANAIMFANKTNDPWYDATKIVAWRTSPSQETDDNGDPMFYNSSYYGQNTVASPLGCTVQHQLCNPNHPEGPQCGPLSSVVTFLDSIETIFANQEGAVSRLGWVFDSPYIVPQIYDVVVALGADSLLSRRKMARGVQAQLPDNQWMLDVEHWHHISLASLQGLVITAATGPTEAAVLPFTNRKPNTTEERSICTNQKINSTAYISFSIFWLLFIFILGSIIVLLSIILDPLLSALRRRYGLKQYQQLEWRTNDALQLQRLAYEEVGAGTWLDASETVPITLPGQYLTSLDISTTEHPKLCVPSSHDDVKAGKTGTQVFRTKAISLTESNDQDDISPINEILTNGRTSITVTATSPIATSPATPDRNEATDAAHSPADSHSGQEQTLTSQSTIS